MNPAAERPARYRPSGAGLAVGAAAGFFFRDLDLTTLVSYWGDRAPVVVAGAALGALLWPTRAQRAFAAAAVGLALLWAAVVFTPLTRALVDGLVRRDPLAPVDAAFVFASDIQEDGDFVSVALARIVHGLELVGEGRTRRIVVSELRPPTPSHATAARSLAARLGIAVEILAVGPVRNTREEAVAVARLYRDNGWTRLLVVTSPLHSRRACASLEKEGVTVVCSPARETRYDLEGLGRPDYRLMAFSGALHERVGLWVYARRGWVAR